MTEVNTQKNSIPLRSIAKWGGRVLLIILGVVVIFALIFGGVLLSWSPGTQKPFLNENGKIIAGSISEKIFVDINGSKQGMFIKGKDSSKPILLFVHGGPGVPEYAFTQKYPTGLENVFTVCWWEQRGAGISYDPDIPLDTMTVDQMVADTIEVSKYLCKRFGQEKIYIMAHSWGSYIGIQAAAKAPELYYAYIGMGQITHQIESEKLAYDYMLDYFIKTGDKEMVKKLEAAPVTAETTKLSDAYKKIRDEAMTKAGIGTIRKMKSVMTDLYLSGFKHTEYTLGEKFKFLNGIKFCSSTGMWEQMQAADIKTLVPKLDIPVYFFSGKYDLNVSRVLAKEYFDKLEAPMKGFYTFEESAHSPIFEEPEKVQSMLREDVLKGTINLADKE